MNIHTLQDDTDHIAFQCPECRQLCTIDSVKTEFICVDYDENRYDNCTYIDAICECHNKRPHMVRKFYWTSGELSDFHHSMLPPNA